MKSSDHLGMYLEACMTTPSGRKEILSDEKVRQELGSLPVNGKALMEALFLAAKKQGSNGGNVIAYLNTQAEQRNFLQYFDGWFSTEDASLRIMTK